MRKRALLIPLIVLLFNTVASLDVGRNIRLGAAQAQLIPSIYIDPPETKDPLLTTGQEFTVSLSISNAEGSSEGLYGWQAKIAFNSEVVNCTARAKIVQGPFLQDWFGGAQYTTFQRSINYAEGYVLVACSKRPPYESGGATGNGILAYITFTVVAEGRATLLHIADIGVTTYLRSAALGTLVPIEPFTTDDGIFDNRTPGANAIPVAGFSLLSYSVGIRGQVTFDASTSYDPDAWILSYHWDFGDGTTEIYLRERFRDINLTTTPTHLYTHGDTYTVMLTLKDSDNATASTSSEITVKFDVAVTNVESPFVAVMPGTIVTLNVTVGNYGDFTEKCNVTAYYNSTAIGTIEAAGLEPLEQQTLMFNWNTTDLDYGKYLLKANAGIVNGEDNITNNEFINGFITIAGTTIVNYPVVVGEVTFNVNVESTSSISTFTFNRAEKKIGFNLAGALGWFGNVTIPMALLNVSSPSAWIVKLGGSNITYTSISNSTHYFIYFNYTQNPDQRTVEIIGETVATPPTALFTVSRTVALVGEDLTFDASSSYDPDGTIESWYWNYGDGTTDAGQIVQHIFTSHGIYTVTLTVKDNEQLLNSTQKTLTIIDKPIASFSYAPTEPLVDQTMSFDATASDPVGGAMVNYAWEFGDGETGAGQTTTHSYLAPGTYPVKLTVTDSEDLTNATTKTIIVKIHDIAITNLTTTPSTLKIGQTAEIKVTVANKGNFSETFTITISRNNTTIETQTVMALTAGSSETLTASWTPLSVGPGLYAIKAQTSNISGETRTNDNIRAGVTLTLQKRISSLTLTSSPATLALGDEAIITGTLTPTLQGKTITLQYKLVGQSWTTLDTTTTDAQGKYEFTWTPDTAGTYEIQVTWQGDTSTEASQSNVQTITVQEAEAPSIPIQYVVGALASIIVLIAVVVYLIRFRKR